MLNVCFYKGTLSFFHEVCSHFYQNRQEKWDIFSHAKEKGERQSDAPKVKRDITYPKVERD